MCMRKILTLSLLAIFSLLVSAQNLEQVFDMDKLAASKGFLLSQRQTCILPFCLMPKSQ